MNGTAFNPPKADDATLAAMRGIAARPLPPAPALTFGHKLGLAFLQGADPNAAAEVEGFLRDEIAGRVTADQAEADRRAQALRDLSAAESQARQYSLGKFNAETNQAIAEVNILRYVSDQAAQERELVQAEQVRSDRQELLGATIASDSEVMDPLQSENEEMQASLPPGVSALRSEAATVDAAMMRYATILAKVQQQGATTLANEAMDEIETARKNIFEAVNRRNDVLEGIEKGRAAMERAQLMADAASGRAARLDRVTLDGLTDAFSGVLYAVQVKNFARMHPEAFGIEGYRPDMLLSPEAMRGRALLQGAEAPIRKAFAGSNVTPTEIAALLGFLPAYPSLDKTVSIAFDTTASTMLQKLSIHLDNLEDSGKDVSRYRDRMSFFEDMLRASQDGGPTSTYIDPAGNVGSMTGPRRLPAGSMMMPFLTPEGLSMFYDPNTGNYMVDE